MDNSIESVTARRLRAWQRAIAADAALPRNAHIDAVQKSHDKVCATESHIIKLGVSAKIMIEAGYAVIGAKAEKYVA